MNENTKTLTFVVVAGLVVVVAVLIRPRPPRATEETDVRGQSLFADFQPLDATSLEIFDFDEERATVRPFKVVQAPGKDGTVRWSIPSHDNYPADAQNQLADAASSMMGLTILDKVADSPGEHATYGVIEPDPARLRAGATGVGTKVILRDKDNKELVSLIIGRDVPDRQNLRYVRRVGEDPVYIVEVKTDKLSTKFEDWIEEDLLKISTWDIREVRALDYSFDELAGQPNIRGQFALRYNDTGDPRWELLEDRVIQDGAWVDRQLGEDQELDATKLDAMRNAFDDLEIVDVATKPEGLSSDLRDTGTFRTNREAVMSLANRGFYLVPVGGQHYELLSSEGEVRVIMKDGVQYTLRFGNVAAGTGGGRVVGEETTEDPETDLNRFIFVMAEFNPDMIEKPELEPLPGDTPKAETGDEKPDDTSPEGDAVDGEDKPGDPPDSGESDDEPADKGQAEDEGAEKDLQAERERIERENKRKQDEYDRKIEDGKKKVQELNDRFADWYYVISDEVYKKIHLSRDEIVKPKEKKTDDDHEHEHGDEDSDENPLKTFGNMKEAGPEGDR
ncbi:MAG: DUF4340 domain-containing protein [Thermoguttaceae bacterium]|jgi:hypothetical protein|nr:DUF4340 domain-containing protein [Thermoguttaceae bacterium]